MMVKCNKCGKEIDYLLFSVKCWHHGTFSLKETYTKDYGDYEDWTLECPECNKVLFTDDEEAREFLEDGLTAEEKKLPFPNQYEKLKDM